MAAVTCQDISNSLQQLYVDDPRPWLVGFSGGNDSTLVAALVFDAVISLLPEQRTKPVLYASTSNGECPMQIDTGTPSCGPFTRSAANDIPRPWERERMSAGQVRVVGEKQFNATRAGVRCRNRWTCTVVERDNWVARATRLRKSATRRRNSEGLRASGDERMEHLIAFRETLLEFQDPTNGKRDMKRMTARISHKRAQRSQRTGGANVFTLSASIGEKAGVRCRNPVAFRTPRSQFRICPANRLRELQEQMAAEKGIRADALRRLLAKVDEFSESHRAFGLPDNLLGMLKDDVAEHGETVLNGRC